MAADYRRIERRFVAWAKRQDGIRAAAVIGSRARTDHPADAWSDLDVLVFAEDPARFVSSADWILDVGVPQLTFVEPTAAGDSEERRVLFQRGLDVDFAFFPATLLNGMSDPLWAATFEDVLGRGVRILLDKDARLAPMASRVPERRAAARPSATEFDGAVNDFWYHAVWTAKHLRRGELWWAKGGCDEHMKTLLRAMLAWHARATRTGEQDTWMRGRFLEEWADPRAQRQLRDTFAHYDEDDVWRALFATMELYEWLTEETAEAMHVALPRKGIAQAQALVCRMYDGRPPRRGSRTHGRRAH